MKSVDTKLREILPIQWTKKQMDTAIWGKETLPDGRVSFWIRHEPVKAITPEMLVWWFQNLEGDIEFQGQTYNRYHVWHPEDHVHNSYSKRLPDGSVGSGAVIRLVEYLGRNPKYKINVETEIEKLDVTGFIHNPKFLGVIPIARMEYEFTTLPNATQYNNRLIIGWKHWSWRFFKFFVTKFAFNEKRGLAWIKHNIEEVGQFEAFLPALYKKELM
ncbi:hypothetical protein P3G55_11190 [Leptospira sp. 96542]|nr:hypothetical protein [Leptospira sp. 96542]